MDRIKQLQERKAALERQRGDIPEAIKALADEGSFVELSSFSFSEGRFFDGDGGEGVVTGFFTVAGYPFYLVAQNFDRRFGGITKANCGKIERVLDAAEKNETPVVWLLRSRGVKLGEGVDVLEGISALFAKASRLKGVAPQYAVVGGEVYGAAAEIAALADVVFFLKEGALSTASPLVLSAKAGKNLKKEEVGGYAALKNAGLPAIEAKDLEEVASYLKQFTELFGIPLGDAELNERLPALNEKADAEALSALIEDGVELGANCAPEIRTILGRVGGIAVAAAVFDRVRLNARSARKIRRFAEFACRFGLPFVTFVDCEGIEPALSVNDSPVLGEIAEYLDALDAMEAGKIAVVTGKAVGLGYSLFAAKSVGFDYTYALATSEVALFESRAGAEIVYANETGKSKDELLALYEEQYSDPVNAARGGYLDNIFEPQFLKQYLIASLQMLLR